MSLMTPERYDVDAAVVAFLAELTERPTGLRDAPTPEAGQSRPEYPYTVVVPVTGGVYEGSIGRPYQNWSVTYQVTSVSNDARGCAWMAHKNREAMLDTSQQISLGEEEELREIGDRVPQGAPGAPEKAEADLYYQNELFRVTICLI